MNIPYGNTSIHLPMDDLNVTVIGRDFSDGGEVDIQVEIETSGLREFIVQGDRVVILVPDKTRYAATEG